MQPVKLRHEHARIRKPGIAEIFADIFTAGDGAQIFVTNIRVFPSSLVGKTFAEVALLFPTSVLIGWMWPNACAACGWSVDIAPGPADVATEHMKLIFLSAARWQTCSSKTGALLEPAAVDRENEKGALKSCVALSRTQRQCKSVLILNARTDGGNTYLNDRIADGGDRVKATFPWQHTLCQDVSLANLKTFLPHVLNADVLVLQHFCNQDGTVASDSDAKAITAAKMINLLRQQAKSEGRVLPHLHMVVCMHREMSVPLLQIACAGPDMSVEYINSNEVEAGAIVQMLVTPALQPVFTALLEAGSDLFLIPAHLIFELGQRLSFGQISQAVMHRKAIAMGIKRADGSSELAPAKSKVMELRFGDQIIVVADFETSKGRLA